MGLFSRKQQPVFVVRVWDGEQWHYHQQLEKGHSPDRLIALLQEYYPGCPVELTDDYPDWGA